MKRNYPVSELMRDVSMEVLTQWQRANFLFQSPVICTQKSMERRMEKEWKRAKLAAYQKLSQALRVDLESKLDKLFDPLR